MKHLVNFFINFIKILKIVGGCFDLYSREKKILVLLLDNFFEKNKAAVAGIMFIEYFYEMSAEKNIFDQNLALSDLGSSSASVYCFTGQTRKSALYTGLENKFLNQFSETRGEFLNSFNHFLKGY